MVGFKGKQVRLRSSRLSNDINITVTQGPPGVTEGKGVDFNLIPESKGGENSFGIGITSASRRSDRDFFSFDIFDRVDAGTLWSHKHKGACIQFGKSPQVVM